MNTRISDFNEKHFNLILVTQVGQNWNQLITELNSWYQFGLSLENHNNNLILQ